MPSPSSSSAASSGGSRRGHRGRKRKADDRGEGNEGSYTSRSSVVARTLESEDALWIGHPWQCRDCRWKQLERELSTKTKKKMTERVNSDEGTGLYSRIHEFVEETWTEPWHTPAAFDKLYGIMKQCDAEKDSKGREFSRKAVCRCVAALCKLRFATVNDPWTEEQGGAAKENDDSELEQSREELVLEAVSTALRQTGDKASDLASILSGIEFQLRMRYLTGLDASQWTESTIQPLLQRKVGSHAIRVLLGIRENAENAEQSYSRSSAFLLLKHSLFADSVDNPSPDFNRVEFSWTLLKELFVNENLEHFTKSLSLDLLLALTSQTYRYTENKTQEATTKGNSGKQKKQGSSSFSLTMASVAFEVLGSAIDNIMSLTESVVEDASTAWSAVPFDVQESKKGALKGELYGMFNLQRGAFKFVEAQEHSRVSLFPTIWDEFRHYRREYMKEDGEGVGKYHSWIFHCKLLLASVDLLLGVSTNEYQSKMRKCRVGESPPLARKLVSICSRAMRRTFSLTNDAKMLDAVLVRITYIMQLLKLETKPTPGLDLDELLAPVNTISSHYLDFIDTMLVFAHSTSRIAQLRAATSTEDSIIRFCCDVENWIQGIEGCSWCSLPITSPGAISKVFGHIQQRRDTLSFARLAKGLAHTLSNSNDVSLASLRTRIQGNGDPLLLQIKPLVELCFFVKGSTYLFSIKDLSLLLFCHTFWEMLSCGDDEKCFYINENIFQQVSIAVPALYADGTAKVPLEPGFYNSECLFPFLSNPDLLNSIFVDDVVEWSLLYAVLSNLFSMIVQTLVGYPWASAGEEYLTARIATDSVLRRCIAGLLRCIKSFKVCESRILTKASASIEEIPVLDSPSKRQTRHTTAEETGIDSSITEVSERRRRKRVSSRYRNLEGGMTSGSGAQYESHSVGDVRDESTHDDTLQDEQLPERDLAWEKKERKSFAVKQGRLHVWLSYLNVVETSLLGDMPPSILVSSLYWLSYVSQMRMNFSGDDSSVDDVWKDSIIASGGPTAGRTVSVKPQTQFRLMIDEIRSHKRSGNIANSQHAVALHSAFIQKVGNLTQMEVVDWLLIVYTLLRVFAVSPVSSDSCAAECSTIWNLVSRPPDTDRVQLISGELHTLAKTVDKVERLRKAEKRQYPTPESSSFADLEHMCFLVPWLWAQIEPLLEQLHLARKEEALRVSMVMRDTTSAREHSRKVEEMKRKTRRSELMENIELARKQGHDYPIDLGLEDATMDVTPNESSEQDTEQDTGGTSPRVIEALLLAQSKIVQNFFRSVRVKAATERELIEYGVGLEPSSALADTYIRSLLHALASMTEGIQATVEAPKKLFEKYVVEYQDYSEGRYVCNSDHVELSSMSRSSSLFTDPERSHARWCFGVNESASASGRLDSCVTLDATNSTDSLRPTRETDVITLTSDTSVSENEIPLIKPKPTYAQVGKTMEQQMRETSNGLAGDSEDKLTISNTEALSFWCAFVLENQEYASQVLEASTNAQASSASESFVTLLEDLRRIISSFPLNHSHVCLSIVDMLSALRITAEDCLQQERIDKTVAGTLFALAGSPLSVSLERPFRTSDKLERTYDLRLNNLPYIPGDLGATDNFRSQQRCIIDSVLRSSSQEDEGEEELATAHQRIGVSDREHTVDPLWYNAIKAPTSRFVWQHWSVSWYAFYVPRFLPVALQHEVNTFGGNLLVQHWANSFLTRATGNFITTGLLSVGDSESPLFHRNTISAVPAGPRSDFINDSSLLRITEWNIRTSSNPDDFDLRPVEYGLYSCLSLVGTSSQFMLSLSVAHALAVSLNTRVWEEQSPLRLPPAGEASTFEGGVSMASLNNIQSISSCLSLGASLDDTDTETTLYDWCSNLDSWGTQLAMLLKISWMILFKLEPFDQPHQASIDEIILNTVLGIGEVSDPCMGLILKHGLHSPAASSLDGDSDQGVLSAFLNEQFVQTRRALSLLQLIYSMALTHLTCEDCPDTHFGDALVQLTEINVGMLVDTFQQLRNGLKNETVPRFEVQTILAMQSIVVQKRALLDLIADLCDEGAKKSSAWHSFEADRLVYLGNHTQEIENQILNMAEDERVVEDPPWYDCRFPSWQELCCTPTYYTEVSALPEVTSKLPKLPRDAIPELGGKVIGKKRLFRQDRLYYLKWRRLLALPNIFDPREAGEAMHREVAHIQVNNSTSSSVCETPLGHIILPFGV